MKFCLFRADQTILTGFYNDGQWENIFSSINSQFFQQEVGLKHVQCWKSENIRAIHRYTGTFQRSLALSNIRYNCVVLFLGQL